MNIKTLTAAAALMLFAGAANPALADKATDEVIMNHWGRQVNHACLVEPVKPVFCINATRMYLGVVKTQLGIDEAIRVGKLLERSDGLPEGFLTTNIPQTNGLPGGILPSGRVLYGMYGYGY
jgi:hypothetical protein